MAEVWPFLPLPEIGERLSWLTSVHERRDDTSRWSLRDPRQTWTLRHRCGAARADAMRWLFRSNALGEWDVPAWTDATRVSVSSGDTSIECSTAAHYEVGGQAIIWGDCDSYTVRTVEAVMGSGITLAASVGTDYAAALVMPLLTCIAREGLSMTRVTKEFWEAEIAFERPMASALGPVRVMFAVDRSGSMINPVDPYNPVISRLGAAQAFVASGLDYLEATGLVHDVRVLGWNSGEPGSVGLERIACDAADYDDLRAFVASLTIAGGSNYTEAFDGAPSFFDGSKPHHMILLTDGGGSNSTTAASLRDAIAGLAVHGVAIGGPATESLDEVDNTGGAVESDGSAASAEAILSSSLTEAARGVPFHAGAVYFACAGAVLEPVSGRIAQAATFIDSGLGPVRIEADRSYVEDLAEATIRESGSSGVWAMKQTLLAIRGQDAPFWMPVAGHDILASTTTTIDIASRRSDPLDWIGEHIDAGGQQREVTNAALVSGRYRLTVDALSSAPTGRMRRLALMRGRSDEVEIRHRRGRWAEAKLTVGTP